MITGAVFDIDGTLLDSMGIWRELGERCLAALGVAAEAGPAEADLADILYPMSLEESSDYLRARYSLTQSPEEITRDTLRIVEDFYRREVRLKPGVAELLRTLDSRGIPMVLATAGDEGLSMAALRRLQVDRYFKGIFTCTALNTTKKEPHIYLQAAAFIGSRPENTLVFEDAVHALHTAKRGGFVTVAVNDPTNQSCREEWRAAADYYLERFADCSRFFERWFGDH